MQLAEASWSPAKASHCNRNKLASQGEQVIMPLELDNPEVCVQEGALKIVI